MRKAAILLKTVGIVCEYNPLHKGHRKQLRAIRELCGEDTAIVCAMSGDFVQRGAPAIVDKSLRAEAAVRCGADLVLELPVTRALQSAEGFAAGGVEVLKGLCDTLCFGAETPDRDGLMACAKALISEDFPPLLREELEKGCSFPAARQAALERLGLDPAIVREPNDILGIEYCKAILTQNAAMEILPIKREGSYHAEIADGENPSATAVRELMLYRHNWRTFVPRNARALFEGAPLHTMAAGERAVLFRLRTMTDEDFEALPYGSEGLWRKFMRACREEATLEDIIAATKSKRYTRTRIDRMIMCAYLGIDRELLTAPVPYTRVLAFTDKGRAILKEAKKTGRYLNAGERGEGPFWELEKRCEDLYGLFQVSGTAAPGAAEKRRIFYLANNGE